MKESINLCGDIYDSSQSLMQRYGISTMTLWRWTRRGLLPPPIKVGRKSYYPRDEVESRLVSPK